MLQVEVRWMSVSCGADLSDFSLIDWNKLEAKLDNIHASRKQHRYILSWFRLFIIQYFLGSCFCLKKGMKQQTWNKKFISGRSFLFWRACLTVALSNNIGWRISNELYSLRWPVNLLGRDRRASLSCKAFSWPNPIRNFLTPIAAKLSLRALSFFGW